MEYLKLTSTAAILVLSASANAAVIYTADNRYMLEQDCQSSCSNTTYYPEADFSDWTFGDNNYWFSAGHISSFNSTGFTTRGGGAYDFIDTYDSLGYDSSYYMHSYFDVSFTLTTSSEIQIDGSLWAGSDGTYGGGSNSQGSSVYLYDNSSNLIFGDSMVVSDYGLEAETPFNYTALLNEGDYRLIAVADPVGNIVSYAEYSMQVSFAPVPIPATAWLLGSGLIGLVRFARRKKVQ